MILFSDPYELRGGGQVCLEYMLANLNSRDYDNVGLVMPVAGREKIEITSSCTTFDSREELISRIPQGEPIVLVSNANRGFPADLRMASELRKNKHKVHTVAIVHNYPVTLPKYVATRLSLRGFDTTIVDEPGLTKLAREARTPAWVAPIFTGSPLDLSRPEPVAFTGDVKSFGRPDPSKGLHYLPRAFAKLAERGLNCRVALGNSLETKAKYSSRLRSELAPWLEDGYRTQDWINPGDIFIVPSIGGETTCQAAQEAISRGAYVVTTRVGVLPYMLPEGGGYDVVPPRDSDAIAEAVERASLLSAEVFDKAVRLGAEQIRRRSNLYYDQVSEIFIDQERTLRA